jgi:hypothetical protein
MFVGLWYEMTNSGLLWMLFPALLCLVRFPWKRAQWILVFALLGQAAATLGWMFSLGVVFSRMTVIPGMVLAVIAASELSFRWDRFSVWSKRVLVPFTCCLLFWTVYTSVAHVQRMFRVMRYDVELVRTVESCPDEVWSIVPRRHPGPRRRHDGCEVLQGLSDLRAGQEFVCEPWDWGGPEATLRAVWTSKEKAYIVERVGGENTDECPF